MNFHDEEYVPVPTDPKILRRVRLALQRVVVPADVVQLRKMFIEDYNSRIPHEFRGSVWMHLLGLSYDAVLAEEDPVSFAQSARNAVNLNNSKEQIWKDVLRTRPSLKRFQEERIRNALLRFLSLFCHRHSINYIQGLNEILAPFILLPDTSSNPKLLYALFSSFVSRFATFLLDAFEPRVFCTLKLAFSCFARLFLYHDPELFWHLEQLGMSVDLYAPSWFITVFARNFSVQTLFALWDLLLLEDHALAIYFFGLALIVSKRQVLLSIDSSQVPETLMNLAPENVEQVFELWKKASDLRRESTPPSYLRLMIVQVGAAAVNTRKLSDREGRAGDTMDLFHDRATQDLFGEMKWSCCLQVSIDDVALRHQNMQFLILDCRTKDEFNAGHLATAASLNLDTFREFNMNRNQELIPNKDKELDVIVSMSKCAPNELHLCLLGSGEQAFDQYDVYPLAMYLSQHGIQHVSVYRGGFKSVLEQRQRQESVLFDEYELCDYNETKYGNAYRTRMGLTAKMNKNHHQQQPEYCQCAPSLDFELSVRIEKSSEGEKESSVVKKVNENSESVKSSPSLSPSETVKRDQMSWLSRKFGSKTTHKSDDNEIQLSPSLGALEKNASLTNAICKWSAHAEPGWLDESTLSRSVNLVPKSFTVNISKPSVMSGLQLFPCKASYEIGMISDNTSSSSHSNRNTRSTSHDVKKDMKRMYVGVSRYYFVLLCPHAHRAELLNLELIRHLSDVARISFKKSKPNVVSFALITHYVHLKNSQKHKKSNRKNKDGDRIQIESSNTNIPQDTERVTIACEMKDGIADCVALIKTYLGHADQPQRQEAPSSSSSTTAAAARK